MGRHFWVLLSFNSFYNIYVGSMGSSLLFSFLPSASDPPRGRRSTEEGCRGEREEEEEEEEEEEGFLYPLSVYSP